MYCVTTLKELCSAVDAFGIVNFFAGAEEIKDSTPEPASKAFNKSRLHCPRHLMSLALPFLRSRYREATALALALGLLDVNCVINNCGCNYVHKVLVRVRKLCGDNWLNHDCTHLSYIFMIETPLYKYAVAMSPKKFRIPNCHSAMSPNIHTYSLWSPYVIGQTIIFLPCDFYLSSSFFSSPNLSGRRLDVY